MPSSQRVYVGNIGSDIRERDLEKFFKGFGKIGDIAVKNGYGFVDFDDHRDADDAVHDLDGKDFRGSRYVVNMFCTILFIGIKKEPNRIINVYNNVM